MRQTLLRLFAIAIALLPPGLAFGQAKAAAVSPQPSSAVSKPDAPKPEAQSPLRPGSGQAPPAVLELTDLQKARLDTARQKVWRWQDKINDALQEFVAICDAAGKENRWPPAVQCDLNDLSVRVAPPPPAAAAPPAATPPK